MPYSAPSTAVGRRVSGLSASYHQASSAPAAGAGMGAYLGVYQVAPLAPRPGDPAYRDE